MHAQPQQRHTCVVDLPVGIGRPIDISTMSCPNSCLYVDGIIGICPVVHGFAQAVYTVNEEEILNTRFQLNVKSMTRFPGLLNIQGTIRSMEGGDASAYTH